eukprot:TRINITY_DN34889_c0_g1_i1.p1 TRINITY_DN34889_c0_g1~~TRINITY_DN34889_c0_g1_i1.p1  ORF type:complete len:369 (-),score=56.56 TRINITY_DN34889_c0_g1_i1:69-1175(-)
MGRSSSRERRGDGGRRQEVSRRSRSRRRRHRAPSTQSDRPHENDTSQARVGRDGDELYELHLLSNVHRQPLFVHHVPVKDGNDVDAGPRLVPHVCSMPGEGYVIRVTNRSRHHIACAIAVDGENALLREGSLIVAPNDSRELPGFLVSKNFVGKEYVKEYRDFRFSKPRVVEAVSRTDPQESISSYGLVTCDVFNAVLDEEVSDDQELRGQSTFFRGAGLNGSFEDRRIVEGKKTHLLYSSVTAQGPRSAISNSTRGRWWVRGAERLQRLEVRYREEHSLMLLGVHPKELGLVKNEMYDFGGSTAKKEEDWDGKDEKEEKFADDQPSGHGVLAGVMELCNLDSDDENGRGRWSQREAPDRAEPVDVSH